MFPPRGVLCQRNNRPLHLDPTGRHHRGTKISGQETKRIPKKMLQVASKCIEIHEICPLCAGAHASDQCKVLPINYRCINCTKSKRPTNHAVWDCSCPS